MIFSDPIFIFLFFPLAWFAWFAASYLTRGVTVPIAWITLSSIVFYSWWHIDNVVVILGSVLFNYCMAQVVSRASTQTVGRILLGVGIGANLGLLVLFKYFHFLFGMKLGLVLPLAISFFTFQQISYLVDVYHGMRAESSLLRFTFYVTFFPQLIAGPIVHFREIHPQLPDFSARGLRRAEFVTGFKRFLTGLAKKVLIADALAPFVNAAFALPGNGAPMGTTVAWAAAICFYFQIYFDFSGYSDMALGMAKMFGMRLPENFAGPYRAGSLIDFWRRWHITLSTFLRDYLYIPLGGNRRGVAMQMTSILVTMLLGGLWHGASWNFVAWGALHGAGIVVNHAWRKSEFCTGRQDFLSAAILTQAFILFTWILFRAETIADAGAMLAAMLPGDSLGWEQLIATARATRIPLLQSYRGSIDTAWASLAYIGIALAAAMVATWPVANGFGRACGRLGHFIPTALGQLCWRSIGYAGLQITVFAALASRIIESSVVQPFIYFQF